jgi:ATP-binding cassette subfamily A (ABC1) protein 3
MLLSTHFMDEADMLGDRIAVMADGRLKAMGSGLFLKSRYGVGYTLVVVKEEQSTPSAPIEAVVRAAVPAAEVTSEAGAELAFRLPFAASPVFAGLFRELDARKARGELRISTYGISVTTLLEVFLRIGDDRVNAHGSPRTPLPLAAAAVADVEKRSKSSSSSSGDTALVVRPEREDASFSRHMQALLVKRYIYASRDRKSQCCQLVLPALLILFGLSLIKLLGNPLIQDNLILSPLMLNPNLAPEARNPFPVLATSPAARAVMAELDVSRGLSASFIDVAAAAAVAVAAEGGGDPFNSCAVGATEVLKMSSYLASTAIEGETGAASRYGALTFADSTNATHFTYNLLLNASALHGAGVYMNLASNAILRTLVGEEGLQPSIITRNHPLPLTHEEERASFLIEANTASTFVLIGLSFISASIAIFIVKETESKAKHQQIISGVSLLAYWLANFVWDVLSWLPPLGITLALMYAFQISSYTTGQAAGAFVLLFVAFAPAATAFTYVWTFCFSSHSAAQTVILFLNFLTGLVLSIVSFVLSLIDSTRAINLKLRYVFRLFPAFCFGDGLLQLALCVDDVCPKITAAGISITEPLTPLHWDVTLADVVFLLVEALVYFLITLLIEHARAQPWIAALAAWRPTWWGFWRKQKRSGHKGKGKKHKRKDKDEEEAAGVGGKGKGNAGGGNGSNGGAEEDEEDEEDEDVKAEAERVLGGASKRAKDVVRLEKLRKVYQTPQGPKVAVRGLSFGIPKGETFGFLGINGAGKTTTLSMLSGEFPPTSGAAYVAGHSITTEQNKLRKNIGYCPQVRQGGREEGKEGGREGGRIRDIRVSLHQFITDSTQPSFPPSLLPSLSSPR